jgi:hypothetical protein
MTFYRVPTEFLLAIACALTALPLRALRFHGALTALPLRALRFHGALTVLLLRAIVAYNLLPSSSCGRTQTLLRRWALLFRRVRMICITSASWCICLTRLAALHQSW